MQMHLETGGKERRVLPFLRKRGQTGLKVMATVICEVNRGKRHLDIDQTGLCD